MCVCMCVAGLVEFPSGLSCVISSSALPTESCSDTVSYLRVGSGKVLPVDFSSKYMEQKDDILLFHCPLFSLMEVHDKCKCFSNFRLYFKFSVYDD